LSDTASHSENRRGKKEWQEANNDHSHGVGPDLGSDDPFTGDTEQSPSSARNSRRGTWSDQTHGKNQQDHGERYANFLRLGNTTFTTGFALPSLCWLLSPILGRTAHFDSGR
jgi:hypothetical protein